MQRLIFEEVPHTDNTKTYITKTHKTHCCPTSTPQHTIITSQALKIIPLQYMCVHVPIIYAHIAIQICSAIKHQEQLKATAVLRE